MRKDKDSKFFIYNRFAVGVNQVPEEMEVYRHHILQCLLLTNSYVGTKSNLRLHTPEASGNNISLSHKIIQEQKETLPGEVTSEVMVDLHISTANQDSKFTSANKPKLHPRFSSRSFLQTEMWHTIPQVKSRSKTLTSVPGAGTRVILYSSTGDVAESIQLLLHPA
ncbi:hypothetical protein DV515_00002624 [Chloebia gouldiae]|uniref:Uncharacterized protein n=1 Tax=Chloebia gouldiae TaxID=44316 RepID=A0A3L8SV78_CHLGU|nr:hypothetical protein DV515_00002624 [Chloebia gouldiae]